MPGSCINYSEQGCYKPGKSGKVMESQGIEHGQGKSWKVRELSREIPKSQGISLWIGKLVFYSSNFNIKKFFKKTEKFCVLASLTRTSRSLALLVLATFS